MGNKRSEIKHFEADIIYLIESGQINKIVEPFCGSAAVSFHFYKLYGDRLEYHLNDIDPMHMALLNCVKQTGIKPIFEWVNEQCINLTKERFHEIIQKEKLTDLKEKLTDLNSYVFYRKVYHFRRGLFPTTNRKFGGYIADKYKKLDGFFQSEKTHLYHGNYSHIFDKFKEDGKALIFLDPPYLDSSNAEYSEFRGDYMEADGTLIDRTEVFANIGDLFTSKAKVIAVMNDIGIIRYAYREFLRFSYNKNYGLTKNTKSGLKKSKTRHAVFNNFALSPT